MTTATATGEKVIFCHCAYTKILPQPVKDQVHAELTRAGVAFEEVTDLCRLSAEKDPRLAELAAGETRIAACYPRAVKWLFHAAGADLDPERAQVFNMREDSAEDICAGLLGDRRQAPAAGEEVPGLAVEKPEQPWKPWFPVIDFDRCTNCMQCLSFCLFDVYGVSTEKKIQVQNPTKCKTDCPACSRVCPEAAILFPKYRQSPINGAEVREEDLEREKMKVDISSLLGGDIYALLRTRSEHAKSRFSKERDEERALKERKRCLDKLREKLDIPEELMSALPTIEAIQARARQAGAGKSQ